MHALQNNAPDTDFATRGEELDHSARDKSLTRSFVFPSERQCQSLSRAVFELTWRVSLRLEVVLRHRHRRRKVKSSAWTKRQEQPEPSFLDFRDRNWSHRDQRRQRRTVEAHSSQDGVVSLSLANRRWDTGILIPGIQYMQGTPNPVAAPSGVIYRLTTPNSKR